MHKERQSLSHLLNSGKKGRAGGNNKALTVNAIPVMAANTSQSEHTWNPDACAYQNTADYQGNAGALCC